MHIIIVINVDLDITEYLNVYSNVPDSFCDPASNKIIMDYGLVTIPGHTCEKNFIGIMLNRIEMIKTRIQLGMF